MAVMKEFVCLAHGDFDALAGDDLAPCPHGCSVSMVQRVFRTAPVYHSGGTRSVDNSIETLMREQGVTDVNQRGGDGMRMTDWRASKRMSESVAMMGHGANSNTDMNQFFAPVSAMGKYASGAPPSVVRNDQGQIVVAGSGVALNKPGVIVQGTFDGRSLGTPGE